MNYQHSIPHELGDFKIVQRLGSGSLGSVYQALQGSRQQTVGLKIISSRHGLTSKAIHHVKQLVASVAQLQHPHIVPVFETGELGLLAYYTMEFIEGPSLDRIMLRMKYHRATMHLEESVRPASDPLAEECPDWALRKFCSAGQRVDADPAPGVSTPTEFSAFQNSAFHNFRTIAGMIADVADALACAHQAGIVHHDIKPTNLLLSPDGRLQVVDFGLARLLEQPGMTLSYELLGQATYMAPECIQAGSRPADQRADIYSLGAVLYECLTLEPPFKDRQREPTATQLLQIDPLPPRQINTSIPRDLQTICLKAMQEEPGQRYHTAKALAEDLRHFAAHREITARPVSVVSKQVKWHKRHWGYTTSVLLAALFVVGVGSVGYRIYSSIQARSNRLLNESIDAASVTAFSGDSEKTLEKIAAVETRGAEPWVSNMLKGQLALFSGQPAEAVKELELGLQLNAESIEMKVLLARAFLELGHAEKTTALELELLQTVPVNLREKLFLGAWLSEFDLLLGYGLVKPAYDAASWSNQLASLKYAQILWRRVQDTREVAACAEAIQAAYLISQFCKDNSFARAMEVKTALVASSAIRDTKQVVTTGGVAMDSKKLEQKALAFLEQLDKDFPDAQATALAWAWRGYYAEISDERLLAFREALARLEKRRVPVPLALRRAHALDLYGTDQLSAAEHELDSLLAAGDTEIEFLLAISLAGGPGGIEAARFAINRLAAPRRGIAALHRPTGLQVLGKPDEARILYEQIRDSKETPAYRHGWLQQLLRYNCSEISQQALIAAMDQPSISYLNRSEGYFFIAMQFLSRGDRPLAQEHFSKCLQAGVFTAHEFQIARFILNKLESDPNWPSWIPQLTLVDIESMSQNKLRSSMR